MTLTYEISSKARPLRQYLDWELPELRFASAEVRHTLARAPYLACPDNVTPGVAGHAVSAALGWHLGGSLYAPHMFMASVPFRVVEDLIGLTPTGDVDVDARTAVLAGLADQYFRHPDLRHRDFDPLRKVTLDEALAAVPDALAAHVTAVAVTFPLETLTALGPATPGPTFAGSTLCGGADGDILCGKTLIEAKAVKAPELNHVRQLVAYALLDFDDRWALETVALAYLRHATVIAWDLRDLLRQAGTPKTLEIMRAEVEEVLSTGVFRVVFDTPPLED